MRLLATILGTLWIMAVAAGWVWFGAAHDMNWVYWGLSWIPGLFVLLLPFIIYSNQESNR